MSERAHTPPPEPTLLRDVPHGRVLVFAPHPDDEAAGPGGALWLHRRAGDPVRVIVATDGVAGDPDGRYAGSTYAEMRRAESRAGLRELGVDDVAFWGFPDSCELSQSDLDLGTDMAAAELTRYAPDVVYLPWEHEGHPDHHALHLVVTAAMHRVGWRGRAFGYEVWNAMIPDVVLDISAAFDSKRKAMQAHRSQIEYVHYDHCMLGLNAYRSLVHLRGRGYGEAFRLIR